VVVMNQGHITGELPVQECNEHNLGLLMVSQHSSQNSPQSAAPDAADGRAQTAAAQRAHTTAQGEAL
jgi:ABC-type sugar transport system ATPase subunit